jgi:nicotinamidase-related amidase
MKIREPAVHAWPVQTYSMSMARDIDQVNEERGITHIEAVGSQTNHESEYSYRAMNVDGAYKIP